MESLFGPQQLPKDNSPADDTSISTILLYFDEKDASEFKRLAKVGMRQFWPDNYLTEATISEFLLRLLKQQYGTTNTTP